MSKTQNHQTSLAAAFLSAPVKSKSSVAATTTSINSNDVVQHNQQVNNNNDDCHSSCSSQGVSPYHHHQDVMNHQQQQQQFTETIQGPTFVPVFSSVRDILPHHHNNNNHQGPSKGQVPWSCSSCGNTHAFGHKCQNCHKSRDTAALRVFMGQLTKEGDVQLIVKMLEVLCPELDQASSLLHIEPHTHANTGRGKGCAWVYVSSMDQVMYLVRRLHKRTYPTVNAETGEVGFVAFPDSFSTEQIKDAFDNDVTFLADHVIQLFHRSPITAEVPLSLQRVFPPTATTTQQEAREYNNHHHNHNYNSKAQQVQQQQQAAPSNNNNNNSMKVVAYSAPTANKISGLPQQQHQHQEGEETTVVEQQQDINNENVNTITTTTNKMVTTTSPFKRYRWNPYSTTNSRVPLRG